MFDNPTPNLRLPYLIAAQAQKHVTHNEAIRALDALVQITVLDRHLATPPATPADGARYLVPAASAGAWSGQTSKIAAYQDGAWMFYIPREGWTAWVADEDVAVVYDGTAWITLSDPPGTAAGLIAAHTASADPHPVYLTAPEAPAALSGQPVQNLDRLGVNATADATNRLVLASPASLFNHAGNGHQIKLNKNAATDTASLLLQTGFSGRAEIGTSGDDDLHIKVSANGSAFTEALTIDRTTGTVTIPTPLKTSATRPRTDNAYELGATGARWTQIWAVNGVIQTSDSREKTDIESLSGATAGAIVDAVTPVTYRWRTCPAGSESATLASAPTSRPAVTDGAAAATSEPSALAVTTASASTASDADTATTTRSVETATTTALGVTTAGATTATNAAAASLPHVRPGQRRHAGFLAQHVKSALDDCTLDIAAWGLDDATDPDSRQWLRPDQLVPLLWSALRETRADLAKLRAP